jgi:hypothetical protein
VLHKISDKKIKFFDQTNLLISSISDQFNNSKISCIVSWLSTHIDHPVCKFSSNFIQVIYKLGNFAMSIPEIKRKILKVKF